MNTTYEELQPYLTKDNRLWVEDDATMNCEGHEGPREAWKRIFGGEPPKRADALANYDFGDGGAELFPKGIVWTWSFDGAEFFRLPYEARVELGINTAADDLRATLGGDDPTPPARPTPSRDALLDPKFQRGAAAAINDIMGCCHDLSTEAGWWDGVPRPDVPVAEINTKLLLIHTEISEATEGVRKDLMDDKLPHRKMVEVELADALIRINDLAGALGLDLGGAVIEKLVFNATREDHKLEVRAATGGKKF